MQDVIWVGLAGAIGSISRYAANRLSLSLFGPGFPFATLCVNVVGCFVLAFILAQEPHLSSFSARTRLIVGTGFLGAFTTFSAFGYETVRLADASELRLAALNILANVGLGVLAVVAGIRLGR